VRRTPVRRYAADGHCPVFTDPDDDFILELAVAANVRYIVTHNLRNFAGIGAFGLEAITAAQMLLKLQEST